MESKYIIVFADGCMDIEFIKTTNNLKNRILKLNESGEWDVDNCVYDLQTENLLNITLSVTVNIES